MADDSAVLFMGVQRQEEKSREVGIACQSRDQNRRIKPSIKKDNIMNRFILAAAAIVLSGQAFGAVNVFGRIDIGGLPQPPALIVSTPVIVTHGPGVDQREPVYLHVPEDHRRHWSRHCREYNACGERVFFVKDDWYQHQYVPHHDMHEHEHFDRDHHDDRHDHDDHDRGRHDQ
jgi:hypothetical protein